MSNYRRSRVAGGTYFFTLTLEDRRSRLLIDHIAILRDAVRKARAARPFKIDAWVVLPEHMHCIWTLPAGQSDYSARWRDIKIRFVKALPNTEAVSASKARRGERGIWQRRFWEHAITSERDYYAHLDYVHLNPVKHGLVKRAVDWPYSSFHRYLAAGFYQEDFMQGG